MLRNVPCLYEAENGTLRHVINENGTLTIWHLAAKSCQNLFLVFENVNNNKFVSGMLLCLTLDYCTQKLTYQEGRLAVCPGWLLVLEEVQWV